ncbi:MAG: hypothetical protein AAB870_02735 [Patescibacteria group bacterium]
MLIGTIAAASELGAGGGKFAGKATGAITGWANGAIGKYTGQRYAKERYSMYKGIQEGRRKEKVARDVRRIGAAQEWVGKQIGSLPKLASDKIKDVPYVGLLTKAGRDKKMNQLSNEQAKNLEELESATDFSSKFDAHKKLLKTRAQMAAIKVGGASLLAAKLAPAAFGLPFGVPLTAALLSGEIGKIVETAGKAAKGGAKNWRYKEVEEKRKEISGEDPTKIEKGSDETKNGIPTRHAYILERANKRLYATEKEAEDHLKVLKNDGADQMTINTFVASVQKKFGSFGLTDTQIIRSIEVGSMDVKALGSSSFGKNEGELAFVIATKGTKNDNEAMLGEKANKAAVTQGLLERRVKDKTVRPNEAAARFDVTSGSGVDVSDPTKKIYSKENIKLAQTLFKAVSRADKFKADDSVVDGVNIKVGDSVLDKVHEQTFSINDDGTFGSAGATQAEKDIHMNSFRKVLEDEHGWEILQKIDEGRLKGTGNYDSDYAKIIFDVLKNDKTKFKDLNIDKNRAGSKTALGLLLKDIMTKPALRASNPNFQAIYDFMDNDTGGKFKEYYQ